MPTNCSAVYNKDAWSSNTAASDYDTPVATAQKVVTISSAEELALFATEISDYGKNYSGYTVNITADIDLAEHLWKPIKGHGKMSGITINAAYDMGGLAGMIQRKNGVDNGKVENCT